MAGRLLKRIAAEVLGGDRASSIWSRLDIVGDIAIIKKPFDGNVSLSDMVKIAERLIEELPYIKSVWMAATPVEGPYKTREYIHLAGEPRSETVYSEHGCRFKVDIRRAFVTPRLNYEHLRVAGLVRPGEIVVNMFAGVGIFSVIIACKSTPRKVYSIDINPDAYKYMVENVELNRVQGLVEPLLGDAAEVIESSLSNVADRVLMPLPELALEYLPYAVKALRGGRGFIHVYLHVRSPKGSDPFKKAAILVGERLEELGVRYKVVGVRRVRPVGPRTLQMAVDVVIEE
ncbi:MAG: class I SAM-dependent methyltransferase family protein [Desulfurococcales archaeon]|nr:class I SAM-dependent methyltransferase family protein [Desulfurococcales archaeon]